VTRKYHRFSPPYEEPGKSLKCRLAPWLRTIVALDNDEVGDQMPVSNLLVGLILRRVIARQRRRIIGKLNHDIQRTGGAFRNRKLLCADQIASAEFLEDRVITSDISVDRFFVPVTADYSAAVRAVLDNRHF
jgi:hypothetical protein